MSTNDFRRKPAKLRADLLIVERGLANSRELAQALILEGVVYSGETKVIKPGVTLALNAPLEVRQRFPYVSRGGVKLAHALDHFHLDVDGLTALDLGASTGGFTHCLLRRGARRVYALDVGHGQLSYSLRQDPSVVAIERVNAHHPFDLPEPIDLATIDVSFISVTKVIPNVLEHLAYNGPLVVLVKPQFEATQREVPRGGVIRDPRIHAAALARTIAWAVGIGLRLHNLTASPILGSAGNREFFLLLRKGSTSPLG